MSDVLNEFWHISAEEDGIDNIAVALTTYFESLPDCPEGAPINDEHGWTNFAMEKFNNLDKRVTKHFQQQEDELQKVKQERDEATVLLKVAACPNCDGSGAYYDGYGEVCQCQFCYEREAFLNKIGDDRELG